MYLKSLTLRGFKSFASATTLAFEPGITCVVGPNGSGKSNVVDALSWVMGEQGAKTLRGAKMEDVIFAGSGSRPPLGRAEVVLTIDNSDGALPIEYSEVTISRTMFRNGGSDYAINGHPSRLLDVQELLSDSGIGRQMHVIVGQGQLDSILQATPEIRRGFIEEAAGVLKHRKRKEKALRKMDATDANLVRLSDLISELRRQLKPLGRQAEVARKAAVIQADLRDAQARLLADDVTQALAALAVDKQTESRERLARQQIEASLAETREAEEEAEALARERAPAAQRAQATWYAAAGLRERLQATASIADERRRLAAREAIVERQGRDPEALEREAAAAAAQERELQSVVEVSRAAAHQAATARTAAEATLAAAERELSARVRAIADRREGLARLTGEVQTLASRVEAAEAEIGRLASARDEAEQRAAAAAGKFTAIESTIASLDAGESGLDAEHEAAEQTVAELDARTAELVAGEQAVLRARAALQARLEGLRLSLEQKDATADLVAAGIPGLGGTVAAQLRVEPGYEVAVATALDAGARALTVSDLDAAAAAFAHLRRGDLGRAALVVAGVDGPDRSNWPALPQGARYIADLVTATSEVAGAVSGLLDRVAVVPDFAAASALVREVPEVTAVTVTGDHASRWIAVGGNGATPSPVELHAAITAAEQELLAVQARLEQARFAITETANQRTAAVRRVEAALARLHESDARLEAVSEELGRLNQEATTSRAQAERLARAMAEAASTLDRNAAALAETSQRLEMASSADAETQPDPADRDEAAGAARTARTAEMEAGLELRTAEERLRAVAGRADGLRRAAVAERDARERARARKERLLAESETARAVAQAAEWAVDRTSQLLDRAERDRAAAEAARAAAEARMSELRARARQLAGDFEAMVASLYQGELAVAQQEQRLEVLREKALTELGLEEAELVSAFGPRAGVPGVSATGETVETPYVRVEQERRLRAAERDLVTLGRINPLALEEFEALQERHGFLAAQLEDVRRSQADLRAIIAEVDARVEAVFAAAYEDVAAAFEDAFGRLFPGGEGRLILTEPGEWLTTGVDVEARPAGKKLRRLSLLSGGERSLVAVAFLVALFKARPSPFYILDEVEAALDDTNLGRLLEIYEELRATSQLLVITHQKRTMEIADALYGVTMRSDGISAVISERLRDS